VTPVDYIIEIGTMTGWGNYTGVVMLWWMFDESYQHAEGTGHASRVTVGGCAAGASEWYALTMEWAATLEHFGVAEFHMTDFEANKGLFKGWENYPDKHRALLGSLLDVATRHVHNFWGVVRDVENSEGKIGEAYRLCVDDLIKDLARGMYPRQSQKYALVFARHREFRPDLVRAAIEREYPEHFGPVISDSPKSMCPLQLADLVAYEVRCLQRDRQGERHPFCRLRDAAREAGGTFSLSSH
jgi:hypothetical protein